MALNAHVTGPLDDTAEVAALGEDITASAEVAGILGEKVSVL